MKDISAHVLDIMENSAKAGATAVTVRVTWRDAWLTLEISDNGPGLPASVREDPTDPYRTTRADRNVGLGLALLRSAAERTGGSLDVEDPARGAILRVTFDVSHVDAQPLGPLEDALCAAMLAWPRLDLLVLVGSRVVLDTKEVRIDLDGVEVGNPRVQAFLHRQLREELAPLYEWLAARGPRAETP
ncbi:MAG TPA: ATP-binding protein [Spirochaetia bacterium]